MRTLAGLSALVTLGAVAWYTTSDAAAARAWAPNIATSAATVALTVTIIDGIVKREAARRIAPRVDHALSFMRLEFQNILHAVAIDYAITHSTPKPLPARALDLLRLWLDEHECADLPHPHGLTAEDGTLRAAAVEFAEEIQQFEQDDRDVLEPDLIMALRQLRRAANRSEFWQRSAQRRMTKDMPAELAAAIDPRRRAYAVVMVGVLEFAQVLAAYLPEDAYDIPEEWAGELDEWRAEETARRQAISGIRTSGDAQPGDFDRGLGQ